MKQKSIYIVEGLAGPHWPKTTFISWVVAAFQSMEEAQDCVSRMMEHLTAHPSQRPSEDPVWEVGKVEDCDPRKARYHVIGPIDYR